MSPVSSKSVRLPYGRSGCFACEISADRLAAVCDAPQPLANLPRAIRAALNCPIDIPPLRQAVLDSDHVVVALDRWTPESDILIEAVWVALADAGVTADQVSIIQPVSLSNGPPPDPRGRLPQAVRRAVNWSIHDPTDPDACAYLATTTAGERIYLAKDIVEADLVVSVGAMAYDPTIGYRGTHSVFYPGLSTVEAISKSRGQGHRELSPDDVRPLRQLIDEVGWLLGALMTVQVIAAANGGVAEVMVGAADSVFRCGQQRLAEQWLAQLSGRADIVVAAVGGGGQRQGWDQVGAALATARSLVKQRGRIVILSDVASDPGVGLDLVARADNPRDALQSLRETMPPDLVSAAQLADAVDWADVYFLSDLSSDLVEDLFMIPVESEAEAERVLDQSGCCAFIAAAQSAFGRIAADG